MLIVLLTAVGSVVAQNPVAELMERIEKGASKKFKFEIVDPESEEDFFELSTKGSKILVEGNNWISIATGLNWYLRYKAGVQVSHTNSKPKLDYLPKVVGKERHSTDLLVRYYLDTRSASYSSPYWDTERWRQEIDFMALHGITTPLLTIGMGEVWRATLRSAGYSESDIQKFIPHPSYEGLWLDGKIEGWGGATPESFSQRRALIAKEVAAQCEAWGMDYALLGYNGMAPSDSTATDNWHNITSPKFLEPTSEEFSTLSEIYYSELAKIYGEAKYYLVNPYAATTREDGEAIFSSIQSASEGAVWMIGAWDAFPSAELIDYLPRGGVIVIDRWADALPQWGDKSSRWVRKEGFLGHRWIYGVKVNYEGRTAMYGNIARIIEGYSLAREGGAGLSMVGVGATADGVAGNDILYDLLYELPWRDEPLKVNSWVDDYIEARWETISAPLKEAWWILSKTIYSPQYNSEMHGAAQSVFAARPALTVPRASIDGTTDIYYDTVELKRALQIMVTEGYAAENEKNFNYDLVEVGLAVLSNYGLKTLEEIQMAFNRGKREKFKTLSNNFLYAMLLADNLLNSHSETMVGGYIEEAMRAGATPWERDWLRYGARTILSSWGSEVVATDGELHDFAYRVYGGVMGDLYAKRWAKFFNYIDKNESLPDGADYYDIEEGWATDTSGYPTSPVYDTRLVVCEILDFLE